MCIRPIDDNLINAAVSVIHNSFQTVADDFGLTVENCPTNPAFITNEHLQSQRYSGLGLYGYFDDDNLIGVIGIKHSGDNVYSIEKLAVLPMSRHSGIGRKLMSYAIDKIRSNGGLSITLGLINESTVLKRWYESQGFQTVELKNFSFLPFTVCIMCNHLL